MKLAIVFGESEEQIENREFEDQLVEARRRQSMIYLMGLCSCFRKDEFFSRTWLVLTTAVFVR